MYKAPENSAVVVLGASPKENRYSFKAVKMLKEYGHKPIPVHPAGHTVDGVLGVSSLDQIDSLVDTVTCYVNAKISDGAYDQIVKLQPKRVIFNPGAENEKLAEKLKGDGIKVLNACTLVMLRTDQF